MRLNQDHKSENALKNRKTLHMRRRVELKNLPLGQGGVQILE